MADAILVNQRQFKFELVAPEKTELSSLEQRVTLPGEMGDFVVLGGHTLLLAALRPGVVSIEHANGSISRYFITGGLADVGNAHCTILTPNSIPVGKLVADKLQRDIEQLEIRIGDDETLQGEVGLLRLKLDAVVRYQDECSALRA